MIVEDVEGPNASPRLLRFLPLTFDLSPAPRKILLRKFSFIRNFLHSAGEKKLEVIIRAPLVLTGGFSRHRYCTAS